MLASLYPSRLATKARLGRMLRFSTLVLLAASLCAQQRVGRLPDGGAILPNGWPLTPAGRQLELSTLPMSLLLAGGDRHAISLNAGFLTPSLSVVDLDQGRVSQTIPLRDAWLGLTATRKRDRLYVGGGASGSVFELAWKDGALDPGREFHAIDADRQSARDFIGDVRLSADESLLYAANVFRDEVVTLNASSGIRIGGFRTASRPLQDAAWAQTRHDVDQPLGRLVGRALQLDGGSNARGGPHRRAALRHSDRAWHARARARRRGCAANRGAAVRRCRKHERRLGLWAHRGADASSAREDRAWAVPAGAGWYGAHSAGG